MLISKNQTICGHPAVELRELMRTIDGDTFTAGALAQAMNKPQDATDALIDDLVAGGYLEAHVGLTSGRIHHTGAETARRHDTIGYTTTIAGNALAKARIGKPMTRAKAQSLLDGLIARAEETNNDDQWLYTVTKIDLYGSFATDAETVGDIDVAITLVHRYGHQEFDRRRALMLRKSTENIRTMDEFSYPYIKQIKYLRNRSQYIDIADSRSALPPGATLRTVYEHRAPDLEPEPARRPWPPLPTEGN